MWRVFGIATPLPVALHTVASQHISTLHNTPGTHILRYVPAQVKHHLRAGRFLAQRALHIAAQARRHNDVDACRISALARYSVTHTRAACRARCFEVALFGVLFISRARGPCQRAYDQHT
jgi:hypothetical protein